MADEAPTLSVREERSPGAKLLFAVLIGALLAIPLFSIYLLAWDRQSQSETARASIAEGWGGPQTIAGPMLVIPYLAETTESSNEGGRTVTRSKQVWRELFVAPTRLEIDTTINPERRKRSIYEAVLYSARNEGRARYVLPGDLGRYGVQLGQLALDRAELRFGVSDARGLAADNRVVVGGRPAALQPGNGLSATGGSGFFTFVDARSLPQQPLDASFSVGFRGNAHLTLSPRAGETVWRVKSPWPHASYQGGFLPEQPAHGAIDATYRISNLALGTALVSSEEAQPGGAVSVGDPYSRGVTTVPAQANEARISLITPVDLYSQVNRSVKYGFLFIGFTFLAFLMFDVIGGVRVSAVEYLLVGAGLVLFFVMLLAFAEVVGFTPAYLIAAAAIIGLLTAYSAAVLKSWRRGGYIAGLLTALYAVLYVLLSLEAFSLLIGSVLVFVALAAVMYLTRNIDWGKRRPL